MRIVLIAVGCLLLVGCASRHTGASPCGTNLLTEHQVVTALQRHGIRAHAFPKSPPNGLVAKHVDDVFDKLFSGWHVTGGAVAPHLEALVSDSADHAYDIYRSESAPPRHRKLGAPILDRAFIVSNVVLLFAPRRVPAGKGVVRDLCSLAER
jgi:hypothetical protein